MIPPKKKEHEFNSWRNAHELTDRSETFSATRALHALEYCTKEEGSLTLFASASAKDFAESIFEHASFGLDNSTVVFENETNRRGYFFQGKTAGLEFEL